ncbi:MAG: hypothetical protein J2P50_18205, partial [Hyphomicrobiaceae bacterium]|nr:hypothetical protein [Hyphomicrobiaceae bacterium]
GGAQLPGLAPAAVVAATEAALKAEPGKLAPTLRQTLAAGLGTARLAVGQATVAVEIADGQVRTRPVVVDASEGRATGTVRLDLKTLKLDSQWRLEGKPSDGDGAAKPFPAVMVSYRAPVAALGSAELKIDTTALEQELAASKIEHDMQELERLRRQNGAGAAPDGKPPEPPGPPGPPAGPAAPIPPFGHEVHPDVPG